MNGDRIATEGTNNIWSFRGRSTSSWTALSLYASFGNELNIRQIH